MRPGWTVVKQRTSDIPDRRLLTTTFLSFATSFLFKHPSLHSNSFQFLKTHKRNGKKRKKKHGQGHMRQERTHQLSLSLSHTRKHARVHTHTCTRHLSLRMKNKLRLKKTFSPFCLLTLANYYKCSLIKPLKFCFDLFYQSNRHLCHKFRKVYVFVAAVPVQLSKRVVFGMSFPLRVCWC